KTRLSAGFRPASSARSRSVRSGASTRACARARSMGALLSDAGLSEAALLVAQAARVATRMGRKRRIRRPPGPRLPTPPRPRRRVEEYIDEIVPAFSLSAYFEVGLKLAAAAVRSAYRPIIVKRPPDLPRNATAVFLINHRSNFDYVVVGWALAQRVAISYAVGEWARIFPLDALFRAFGGFFVRRGFPDPLYHTVLRRYLQLITRHGVTQGIFPEGGLTRDGALRAPKVGLLDGLLQLALDPAFDRELLFVPVGINYDRVLEDEALLAEKRGREHPPTVPEKLRGALRLLWIVPTRMVFNAFRAATGRLRRSGYAAVAFGEPIAVRALLARRGHLGPGAAAIPLPDDERRELAKDIARELMDRIARCIP